MPTVPLRLRSLAHYVPGPGGARVLAVAPEVVEDVARAAGVSLRQVEIEALEAQLCPERYLRNLGTLGWTGQLRLLRSCVAVIGCGGLGGAVVEGLARSGVGGLVVVDGDCFVAHNLNRQLLCDTAALGRPKAELARERAAMVNPAVEVAVNVAWAGAENLPAMLGPAQVVVDALDTPRDRLLLQAAAKERGIPLVHGAVAGFVGQVSTVFPGDDTLTTLYGSPAAEHGAEYFMGTPTPTPLLVAACQVAEVLKLLTGIGEVLRGVLLYFDLEGGRVERFPLLAPEG